MGETLQIDKIILSDLKKNILKLNNHFGRYQKAIQKLNICKNDIVLDYGCGVGYGSYILSQHSKFVFGIDVKLDYIEKAEKLFEENNIKFITMNYFDNNNIDYDKIICIETIEHITQKEQIFLLNKIGSTKKDFFITFPVGINQPSRYNHFHISEPSIDFVYSELKKYYKKINIEIGHFYNSLEVFQEYCCLEAKE